MRRYPLGRHLTGAVLALACAAAALPALASAETGLLRIRLNADIRSTDPGVNRDENTDAVVMQMVEGLVAYREDASVGPMLAKAVEVSPDGMTYRFTLRDGVTFDNGAALTAEDVLFAWKRYLNPETGWRCLSEFDGRGQAKITNIAAPDPATVVFTLDKPSALFLATMARTDCGEAGIYHKSSLDADGKWREPVGTGPFKFGEWRHGEYIDLVRNDHYAALPGKPDGLTGNKTALVPKLRFAIIPDPSAAKAALMADNIDVISRIQTSDLAELAARPDIAIDSTPTMEVEGILFQTRDPVLKDPRIRKAFLLSLDLPQLVAAASNGQAKPSTSIIPLPSSFYGQPQAALPTRDLPAAKKLLTEAGYKGQPIKMITNKRYEAMFDASVLAQAMAQEAGLNVELEVLDWATELDRYTKGDYQAMSFGYSARLDPSLSFEMISGDKDKQPRKVWDNPDALALLAKSMQVSGKPERQALFDRMEALFRADQPMIPLYSVFGTAAVRKTVQGYKNWALGQPRAWGVSLKQAG
jgi:peptide/nickel transport system substrate-binding protein